METNNQTERVKELKRKGMPQEWKTAMATAVGFLGGGGVAYAVEHMNEPEPAPEPEPEPDKPTVNVVEVVEVEHHVVHHHEPAPEPQPEEPATNLPSFVIIEEEIVTAENGGQMHVAYGVTQDGHLCLIVDEDMDGMADTFYVDTNDNGAIDDGKLETINLTENHIHVNMNYLPMAEVEPVEPFDVDPVEPEVTSGEEVIVAENKPEDSDFINNADLATNDQEPEPEPEQGEEPQPMDDFDNTAMMAPADDPMVDTIIDDGVVDA